MSNYCQSPLSGKFFTWKDLSHLNTRENAHVGYKGKVYNVSSFISKHPGGVEQIMSGAGHDITQVFKAYHKQDTFERVLSKYYVGDLIDNELPVFVNESKFYDTLRNRVEKYMKQHDIDPKVDYRMFMTYCWLILLYLTCIYLLTMFHQYSLFSIIFGLLWGFLTTVIGSTLFHDSSTFVSLLFMTNNIHPASKLISHFAVTHKPWVWKLGSIVSTIVAGFSMYIWRYQHVIGHHSYTNIEGADPDIDTGPENGGGIRRIKTTQQWISRYLLQHIYMPVLYIMVGMKTRLLDFISVYTLMKDDIRLNPLTSSQWLEFCFTKFVHIAVRFIIPSLYIPLLDMLLVTTAFEIACSLSFAHFTQFSHVTNEVEWPKPDKDKKIYVDWAELQVASTQDYCTDSWFWTLVTGALNHQTAHHLFPGYIQSHYHWITPIVKQTCTDYNIKYHYEDSFMNVVKLHYGFLKRMGQSSPTVKVS